MTLKTKLWDVAEHLATPEAMAAYLEAALEENDPAFFRQTIQDVVRSIGMSSVARDSGISREALYKSFG